MIYIYIYIYIFISDILLWTPSHVHANKNLPTIALYRHRMLSGRPAGSDGW